MSSIPLLHAATTGAVIGAFKQVRNELGHGFLESVYSTCLGIALSQDGWQVRREVPVEVWFRGQRAGLFRADMIVDHTVLVEIKAGERLDPNWEPQLFNYLRATELEIGLLLYFGPKPTFKRRILTNDHKVLRPQAAAF